MTNLTTNKHHFAAARLLALASDARRAALKDDADRALAAIHADQARRMRARAVAARNGTPYIGATDMTPPAPRMAPLTSEYTTMNALTTNKHHFAAARFYALAADARRAALNECVDWIERGILPPVYCRIDTAAARYYANQARQMRERAVLTSRGIWTY